MLIKMSSISMHKHRELSTSKKTIVHPIAVVEAMKRKCPLKTIEKDPVENAES
mgnify:FL=1